MRRGMCALGDGSVPVEDKALHEVPAHLRVLAQLERLGEDREHVRGKDALKLLQVVVLLRAGVEAAVEASARDLAADGRADFIVVAVPLQAEPSPGDARAHAPRAPAYLGGFSRRRFHFPLLYHFSHEGVRVRVRYALELRGGCAAQFGGLREDVVDKGSGVACAGLASLARPFCPVGLH